MAIQVKITLDIKIFEKKTKHQLREIINKALCASEDLRDIFIEEFETDIDEKFKDVTKQDS
jgi:hypothetical protein